MTIEKRKYLRKKFNQNVVVSTEDGIQTIGECKAINISVGGLGIYSNNPIKEGTIVTLYFICGNDKISVHAVVVSCKDYIGYYFISLKFIDLSPFFRKIIEDYLKPIGTPESALEIKQEATKDRRDIRKPCNIQVHFYSFQDRELIGSGNFINISLNGALLETDVFLLRDSMLFFEFKINDIKFLVSGTIVGITNTKWLRNYRIVFNSLKKQEIKILQEFIEY